MSAPSGNYQRLLLKLSGEALMGSNDYGINLDTLSGIAEDIKEASNLGCELAIVVGGGNIFRGISGAAEGMERATADYMGMLGTVMNALALQGALSNENIKSRVLSAIPMPTVCESYIRPRALRYLEKKQVVIFAAGTGNPFFTTDTASTLRAIEMNCDVMLKATQVDGVYSADPKQDSGAIRYDEISYEKVLVDNLRVMDGAAIALAKDNDLPVAVCSINEKGGLAKFIRGESNATIVRNI